jgi:hypothetical protein
MRKADSKGSAGTAADSGQNDKFTSVSQHSRKPPVVCSQMSVSGGEKIRLKIDDKLLVVGSRQLKYCELLKAVKQIQDEANKKLVSVLNSCVEPVIIGIVPPHRNIDGNTNVIKEPIKINVFRSEEEFTKTEYPFRLAHVYSASSTCTTT